MNKIFAVLICFASFASHAVWDMPGPLKQFWQPIFQKQQWYAQQIRESAQRRERQERTLEWLHGANKAKIGDDSGILSWGTRALDQNSEKFSSPLERLVDEKNDLEKWNEEGLLSKTEEHRLDFCRQQLKLFFQAEADEAAAKPSETPSADIPDVPGICQLVITPEQAAALFPGVLFWQRAHVDPAASTDQYDIMEVIGTDGTSGTVFRVARASDGQICVAKVVDTLNDRRKAFAAEEVKSLKACDHFAIIRLLESHESKCHNYRLLLTDFANAGDLRNRIRELARQKACFSPSESQLIIAQIILALAEVHRNNILHRDIKGANIFLTDTGIVKLGDFGLSKQYDDVSECHRTEPLGTPLNFAPELYTPMPFCSVKTDIWATGVLLYEMLTLRHPFGEKYRNKPLTNAALETLRKDIFRAQFQPLPDSCCEGLKDLITSMLQFDPESRPDTEQLLKMHYVRKLLAKLKEHISHPDLHTKISEIERARILSDIDRAAPPAILCTQMMN